MLENIGEVMFCKICHEKTYELLDVQFNIIYHRCTACGFIYQDVESHMPLALEKKEYDRHNNSIEDIPYVNMFKKFQKAFEPFLEGKETLEYGSGPEPVFTQILRNDGFSVTPYDPFYLKDESFKLKKYDLITSTEVFEHFSEPIKELTLLDTLLKPGGVLSIMTQFPKEDDHFLNWWYRRDPTHIAFYTRKSFEAICQRFGYRMVFTNDKDYMILKKNKSLEKN